MRYLLVLGLVGAGLLAGCGPDVSGSGYRILGANAPSIIKITNRGEDTLLLGTVETSTYGGDSDPNADYIHKIEQVIQATDGSLTCTTGGNVTGNNLLVLPKLTSYQAKINCSDGRSGVVSVTNNQKRMANGQNPVEGIAIGSLNDGSKIRIIFGDNAASMSW